MKTAYGTDGMPSETFVPAYVWDKQWFDSQRIFGGSNFQKVKIKMRKWDSGWKLEQMLK